MSSPEVAGIVGLARSINPLAPTGTPTGSGIRKLLASSTDRAQQGLGFDTYLGYGLPNALRTVRGMLGNVRGWTARNRATPLFALYSAGFGDYAVTASPQSAVSLMIDEPQLYRTIYEINEPAFIPGDPVPGYASFPSESSTLDEPRAALYVLTTQNSPRPLYPPLVPLYWVERAEYSPSGCIPRSESPRLL